MRSYTVAPLAQVVCVPESALCIMDIADMCPLQQRPVRDYNFYKLELQWPGY